MRVICEGRALRLSMAMLALSASTAVAAQQADTSGSNIVVNGVYAPPPAAMVAGPEIKGVISARKGNQVKVAMADGTDRIIAVTDATQIRSGGGLFGGNRTKLSPAALLNGLPVTVKTLQSVDGGSGLFAKQISFRSADLKTANMIRNATAQRFEEQTAATEALRGRMGDIDKYNIKSTVNVHFDTGKAELSAEDKAKLCTTAAAADSTENALLLVIGYTDSTGSDEVNQQLSEKRAGRVINYLQQACGWKPYRMLTPTGMAKADPAASNDTEEGKAQNRRVAVNVMVSKSVDDL